MKSRTQIFGTLVLAAAMASWLSGCTPPEETKTGSGEHNENHEDGEHKDGEHKDGEHKNGEHKNGEHKNGEHKDEGH